MDKTSKLPVHEQLEMSTEVEEMTAEVDLETENKNDELNPDHLW